MVGLAAVHSPGRLTCAGASGMVGGGQCLLYQEWSEYWAPWVDRGWSSANSCCRHSELLSPSEEAPGGIGEWWRDLGEYQCVCHASVRARVGFVIVSLK